MSRRAATWWCIVSTWKRPSASRLMTATASGSMMSWSASLVTSWAASSAVFSSGYPIAISSATAWLLSSACSSGTRPASMKLGCGPGVGASPDRVVGRAQPARQPAIGWTAGVGRCDQPPQSQRPVESLGAEDRQTRWRRASTVLRAITGPPHPSARARRRCASTTTSPSPHRTAP